MKTEVWNASTLINAWIKLLIKLLTPVSCFLEYVLLTNQSLMTTNQIGLKFIFSPKEIKRPLYISGKKFESDRNGKILFAYDKLLNIHWQWKNNSTILHCLPKHSHNRGELNMEVSLVILLHTVLDSHKIHAHTETSTFLTFCKEHNLQLTMVGQTKCK